MVATLTITDLLRACDEPDVDRFLVLSQLADAYADAGDVLRSDAARWMAEKENRADLIGGINVKSHDPHVARVLLEPETDAPWWFRMEEAYPGFGGYDFPGYRTLAAEGPARLAIEAALRGGALVPPRPEHIPPRRYLNIVRQEERRMRGEKVAFSCACERSFMDDAEDA